MGFERLVLWRRGVDSDVFRPDRPGRAEVRRALGWSPDDVVITYVSRIAPEKNVDYLADALAIVAAQRPEVRILFVGDGPSRGALRGSESGRSLILRAIGRGPTWPTTTRQPTLRVLRAGPRRLGNVVLEAMSSGLPVVALRAGGVGETVESGLDRNPGGAGRAARAVCRGDPLADRPGGRAAADGRGRAGLRAQPELGSDHGLAATALSERHRRTGRSTE